MTIIMGIGECKEKRTLMGIVSFIISLLLICVTLLYF
ncbi:MULTISPECIES: DUF3953 domain-containing protein [Virgibacillus]|nr:DUF3953 domain-containing protein [Virgibacillus massiliensis]